MQTADFVHKPVLFDEVIESLRIKPNGIYVDGTTGGAGHSSGIAENLTDGRLISFDRDADAIAVRGQINCRPFELFRDEKRASFHGYRAN